MKKQEGLKEKEKRVEGGVVERKESKVVRRREK